MSYSRRNPTVKRSNGTISRTREEEKLKGSLHSNEVKQLEGFIKMRNRQVDEEIKELTNKLKITDPTDIFSKSSVLSSPQKSMIDVTGKGINKFKFNHSDTPKLSYKQHNERENQSPNQIIFNQSDLTQFLAIVKLKMEDNRLSPQELKDLLLPQVLGYENETQVTLNELVDVLQVDLSMPVSDRDQMLLIKYYGDDDTGMINIYPLFEDAGLDMPPLDPIPSRPPLPPVFPSKQAAEIPKYGPIIPLSGRNDSDLDDEVDGKFHQFFSQHLPSQGKDSSSLPANPLGKTIDDLLKLHEVIAYDQDYDQKPRNNSETVETDHIFRTEVTYDPTHFKSYFGDKNARGIAIDEKDDITKEEKGENEYETDEEKVRLRKENELLKKEVSHFDSEFFEQLEDLKYRYSRLQAMVGENPTSDVNLNYKTSREGRSSQESTERYNKLPLDKLAWSVRNSMTAMDRAGLTSSLVRGNHTVVNFPEDELSLPAVSPFNPNYTVYDTIRSPSKRRATQDQDTLSTMKTDSFFGIASLTGGSMTNLCERRLAFELSNHPNAEQAVTQLIHRVMSTAMRNETTPGYLLCPQLFDCLRSCGLNLPQKETEILATGFASDGQGGIDANEFCEMLKSLLYSLHHEHSQQLAVSKKKLLEISEKSESVSEIQFLLRELGTSLLSSERRLLLGKHRNFTNFLLYPFCEYDKAQTGVVKYTHFVEILSELGSLLTHQELLTLANHYRGEKVSGRIGKEDEIAENGLTAEKVRNEFRLKQFESSLRGSAKNNELLNEWLSHTGVNLGKSRELGASLDIFVAYHPFVKDFSVTLESLLSEMTLSGGKFLSSAVHWTVSEFELLDFLIEQLEKMKTSARRKILLTLQYTLSLADPHDSYELDGFTVLNALLTSGFHLHRVQRVRLLRVIEELGGKMDYRELIQILLRSVVDWTHDEIKIVQKVLSSMGITIQERRSWLAKLKSSFYLHSARKMKSDRFSAEFAENGDDFFSGMAVKESGAEYLLSPAVFLSCLRDCNVSLSVEEEATLLDCLDTERLIEVGRFNTEKEDNRQSGNGISRRLLSKQSGGSYAVPVINYANFLRFCSRHCGHWYDAIPAVHKSIVDTIRKTTQSSLYVQEVLSILVGFDENQTRKISPRAFRIGCHRSRLLSSLSEDEIDLLTEVLAVDGGGKVQFYPFVMYLRCLCSEAVVHSQKKETNTIVSQLLINATDSENTLYPLRKWLQNHSNVEENLLTSRQLSNLLKEFSIFNTSEHLETFRLHLSSSNGSENRGQLIDMRQLFYVLLKERAHWTLLHPQICKRIMSSLGHIGQKLVGEDTYLPRGIESQVVQKILTRLKLFAIPMDIPESITMNPTRPLYFVEKDIFQAVCRHMSLNLSREEISILSDATDINPLGEYIRYDVLLDVLVIDSEDKMGGAYRQIPSVIRQNDELFVSHPAFLTSRKVIPHSEAIVRVQDHLRQMIWNHGSRLHRSVSEWIADVKTCFQGFDVSGQGLITKEDFFLALRLLNCTASQDLLADLTVLPVSKDGYLDYHSILQYILVPPTSKTLHLVDYLEEDYEETSVYLNKERTDPKKGASVNSHSNLSSGVHTPRHTRVIPDKPLDILTRVLRRSLSTHILSDRSLETAWIHMLKVFQRFDPKTTNQVSPRDFCLAVSVLLDHDDVLLTKAEWAEIVDLFHHSRHDTTASSVYSVDYMTFCDHILNPKEIAQEIKAKNFVSSQKKLGLDSDSPLKVSGARVGLREGNEYGRNGSNNLKHSASQAATMAKNPLRKEKVESNLFFSIGEDDIYKRYHLRDGSNDEGNSNSSSRYSSPSRNPDNYRYTSSRGPKEDSSRSKSNLISTYHHPSRDHTKKSGMSAYKKGTWKT